MTEKQTDQHADMHLPATAVPLPSLDRIQQEVATAPRLDDFFGNQGMLARLFASTREQMLAAELTAHRGYERYAPAGRTSGNRRTGKRTRTLRPSHGDTPIQVPRDRQGPFEPTVLTA